MELASLLDSGSGLELTAQGWQALNKDWKASLTSRNPTCPCPLHLPWTPGFAYISLKPFEKFLLKQVGAWLIGLLPLFSTQLVNNGLYSNVSCLWAGNLRADKAHHCRADCQTHALFCSTPGLCYSVIRPTWQNAKHSHGPVTPELTVSFSPRPPIKYHPKFSRQCIWEQPFKR